jgi:hypothetical protein
MLKPGGSIDSWCGKCKMILAHTIEAIVGNKPARVHCNTCKAQHSYRPNEPAKAPPRMRATGDGAAPPSAKVRASRYQTLLKGKDMAAAKRYSPKDNYEPGDVMQHPNFGVGVAIAVKDGTKVEVLFDAGPKLLVHGR